MLISRSIDNYKIRETAIRIGLNTTVTGLFTMNFFHLLSNFGIGILFLVALYDCIQGKAKIRDFFSSPLFSPFILIFVLFLLGLVITKPGNFNEMFHSIEKRTMFLALPFALIVLPPFPEKAYREVLILFFILVIATAIPCTFIYFLNEESIVESYKISGVLPTPVHHVRYSLMVCYAIFMGIYLLPKKRNLFISLRNILLLTGIAFLIFFLHLLAVRSGLLSFYVIILLVLIYFFIKRNYTALLALTVSIIVLGVFSFQHMETIQTKWAYTVYDLNQAATNKESSNNYSIARRILSTKIALAIFKEHPFWGVGEGNLRAEMNKIYRKDYPYIKEENYITPHNQFLRILAGTGIAGFLVFFSCFYYPLFHNKNYRFFPLICIYTLLSISFLTEDTLQTQLGLMFGLFFIMINLHIIKQKPSVQ